MQKLILTLSIFFNVSCFALNSIDLIIKPADTKFESYVPLLTNKRCAIFTNKAATVDGVSIIIQLSNRNVKLVKIFTPEHGFATTADAGATVRNSQFKDIPIISLYGKKTKPSANDLNNVDVIIVDIQDVGVRFYTYISSLQLLMEAAANRQKKVIILDRPNPNISYIDGPVLDMKYKSFVGMQPIPLVYGMTIAEYAKMLVGEKWLNYMTKNKLDLITITMDNYTHHTPSQLSLPPSPNLPNLRAVYLYPSLGLFEGTKLSVGRGTAMPFQVFGAPAYNKTSTKFSFIPRVTLGANNPPYLNQLCHGWSLQELSTNDDIVKLNLTYLLEAYQQYPLKTKFFNSYFTKLAGNQELQQQITHGFSESQIRASWQTKLTKFKQIRSKYLLYPE